MFRYGEFVHSNCYDYLIKRPDSSVNFLCVDPPYGYDFMGKDWDKVVIPTEYWKELFRIMVEGSWGCVMSAPRQDVYRKIIFNLKDAGFSISYIPIFWSYAQGFPKSTDISKKIDISLGVEREVIGPNPNFRPNSQPFYSLDGTKKNFLINAMNRTVATSELAKNYEGCVAGYQPKPALENIIVIRKPPCEPVNNFQFARFVVVPKTPKKERWIYCKECKTVFSPFEEPEHHDHKFWCNKCKRFTGEGKLHKPKFNNHRKGDLISRWEKHPTQKPKSLFEKLVLVFSEKGDVVIDPFAGSGTLPVVCMETGRKFIGIERKNVYYNIGYSRISYWEDIIYQQQIEMKNSLARWI